MLLKRRLILQIFLLLLLLFFIASASLYFYLPTYVESKILPRFFQKAGIRSVAYDVRRIGFTGADLGGLYIGDPNEPTVSIESVRLDYSLSGLYRGHIDRVVVGGFKMYFEFIDGKFVIPGFDWQKLFAADTPGRNTVEGTAKEQRLPIHIGHFKIQNGDLIGQYNKQRYWLPFDFLLFAKAGNWDTLECVLKLYPRGQEFILSSKIYLPDSKGSLRFYSHSFQLDRFADLAKLIPGLIVSGEMDIDGNSEIQLKPFRVLKSKVTCEFRKTRIDYQKMILQNSPGPQNGTFPLRIEISGGGEQWRVYSSSFAWLSPMPVHISDVNCNLRVSQGRIESSGDFRIALERSNGNEYVPVQILDPLYSRGKFSAQFARTGEWQFRLSNESLSDKSPSLARDSRIRIEMLDIAGKIPQLTITGQGKSTRGRAKYAIQIPDMKVATQFATIKIPSVSLIGAVNLGDDLREDLVASTTFELKGSDIAMDEKSSLIIRVPQFSLSGGIHFPKNTDIHVDMKAKFVDAKVLAAKSKTEITGMSGEIPFQWPPGESAKKGKISVKNVRWDTLKLGTISGALRQRELGIVFDGNHKNQLLSGLALNFHGEAGFFSGKGLASRTNFHIPRFKMASVDLGKYLPSAKGIQFGGEVELQGDVFVDGGNIRCSVNTKLQNSRLEIKNKGLAIEGIYLDLSIPDLLKISSAPDQQFLFEKASLGELVFYDGKVAFQIESPQSIFIEKSGFEWCNGHVYTHAIRIKSGGTDYNIVLYCDRLKLAEIFNQFGIKKAGGKGTVNGRIPLKFEKGKFLFDNGFLYSTPGDGGTIRVTGMEMLTLGLPQNAPQYSQLEFAREALKSFNYNWVKLLLRTEGENVVLQMNLDGRPTKPLPFIYRSDLGTFARIEAGSGRGIDHPIHLAVNFRLPLNKLLGYGKKIEGFIKMMK